MKRFPILVALALATGLAGCTEDQSAADLKPDLSNNDGLFRRYVALGTSISSGLQSGGINDSTQREAFPVLVAEAANASFFYPKLAGRGCPAPIVNNTTSPVTRVGDQPPTTPCELRAVPLPPQLNSLAVPGMWAADFFSNTASPTNTYEQLQLFFLGAQIPVQALMEAQPTFATMELGSNEVLGALLVDRDPGNIDSIYPAAQFEVQYNRLADSLDKLGTKVVTSTVPDVTLSPYVSAAQTWWCLKTGQCPGVPRGPFPANFQVSNNCAPRTPLTPTAKGDSILVPWTKGIPRLVAALTNPGATVTLDCSQDSIMVLPEEYAALRNAKVAYNNIITSTAAARGHGVVDYDAMLQEKRAQGLVPPFPDLSAALTGGPVKFGPYFSLDGFHPSGATHRLIADSVISVTNRLFGTTIPLVGP
jgi:hypothetical protein